MSTKKSSDDDIRMEIRNLTESVNAMQTQMTGFKSTMTEFGNNLAKIVEEMSAHRILMEKVVSHLFDRVDRLEGRVSRLEDKSR